MKKIIFVLFAVQISILFYSCGTGGPVTAQVAGQAGNMGFSGLPPGLMYNQFLPDEFKNSGWKDDSELYEKLDEIAEVERSGARIIGLGFTEAALREQLMDYAGAVSAAYKEMTLVRDYGHGVPVDIEEALTIIRNYLDGVSGGKDGVLAASGILAYMYGSWKEAASLLSAPAERDREPDSYLRWMTTVCAMEERANEDSFKAAKLNYCIFRARFGDSPEYWYRGARAFDGTMAAHYAERCIGLNPEGDSAAECRKILARYLGVNDDNILTRGEIEDYIIQAAYEESPEILDNLMPVITLPDNAFAMYAIGAMQSLLPLPGFKEYFESKAESSGGRLKERLDYIVRG
jgi:hypothetical protein